MTLCLAAAALLCGLPAFAQPTPRSVISLDRGWQLYPMPDFKLWPATAVLTADQIGQLKIPAPGKGWQTVQLPDDYIVRGQFSPVPNASLLAGGAVCPLGGRECGIPDGSPPAGKKGALNRPGRDAYGGHGYLPVYPAWYQRTLSIPASAKDQSVWLDFGGVYRDAVVFVNRQFIDRHASGYTGFRLNITSAVRFGEPNTIAVFVDPRWYEGWWYEGGGIYRHVSLIVTNRLQVAPWGTFVEARVEPASAQLTIQTTVRNADSSRRGFTLVSQIMDAAGKVIASTSGDEQLAARQDATYSQHVGLRDALLWSPEHPNLYTLETTIRAGDTALDKELTTFGVRTLRFDPDLGFFLNGQRVEIRGMCVHHDFPGVGIAAPDNLWAWRISKLQVLGANAWRCAHNPVSEAFYDAADRMGMLVMDENRHLGDTWFPKANETTPYFDLVDAKAMVLQHRNHPSIIMWSLCNEESQGAKPYGAKMFAAMKDAVKKIDPTRPVTGGINGGYTKQGYISVEDILGMNYHNTEFSKIHAEFPAPMIFGSEDINAKTSRGTLETSRDTGLCSQSGCETSEKDPSPGPWRSWVPVVENPFVAGQFVWTGFDYRGEPNPFSWPAVTSQTGVMDLCGFPKPVYYYWRAAWQEKPSVYVFAGQGRSLRTFSNCERVELLLDGKSLGIQDMPRNQFLDWKIPYDRGTLTAIGYNREKVAARYTIHTSGAPAALRLTAELPGLPANGEAVAPVRVEVVDAQGEIVAYSDKLIRFSVSGAGSLAGVANGDPTSHESNTGSARRAFRGLAMVMVRAMDRPGAITVNAQADGLASASIVLHTVR